jgi:AraC-like DNA-binding protein
MWESQAMIDEPLCPFIREADNDIRPPWTSPDRRLLDYLLVAVERGRCRFVVEDHEYFLGSNQVFLVQPGDCVSLEGLTATVTPYVHCDIFARPGREERFSPGPGFLDLAPYQHLVQPRLSDILHTPLSPLIDLPDPQLFHNQLVTCVRLWQTDTQLNRMEAHALLGDLLVTVLRSYLPDEPTTHIPSALLRLDTFLRRNLHEPITVEAMASQAGLSAPHLTRQCRHYWQQSPHQLLLHLRLEHALRLLPNPDLSISQIAHYCGFADVQHFGHVFRRRYGCTPTKARRRGDDHTVQGGHVGAPDGSRPATEALA